MRSHAIRKGGRKQQKSCAQRHVCQRQAIQSCQRRAQATKLSGLQAAPAWRAGRGAEAGRRRAGLRVYLALSRSGHEPGEVRKTEASYPKPENHFGHFFSIPMQPASHRSRWLVS